MQDSQLLAQELQADSVEDRRRAAKMLAFLGETAQAAAIELLHALSDPDEQVTNWVTESLENLGPPRREDLESLENLATTSAHEDTQYFSLVLIGRLGSLASVSFEALRTQLLDPSSNMESATVQQQRLKTLDKIASPAQAEAHLQHLQELALGDREELSELARRLIAKRTAR